MTEGFEGMVSAVEPKPGDFCEGLKELRFEINGKKLKSGRFHRDRVSFMGFDFYAGYFQIAEHKKEEFKNRTLIK